MPLNLPQKKLISKEIGEMERLAIGRAVRQKERQPEESKQDRSLILKARTTFAEIGSRDMESAFLEKVQLLQEAEESIRS